MSDSRHTTGAWTGRLSVLALTLLLAACGTQSYRGTQVAEAHFIDRGITQQVGNITVTAAVPDAAETEALVGLDLYNQGIQPVWIRVENNSPTRARVATWSIDRDYFSPVEVAYMNRKKFSGQGYEDMQRWFYDNGLPRFTEPGETTSGLVFTHLRPGTKGFNLSVFANRTAHDFTFFVPLPGFIADFMEVDFANLYEPAQIRDLDRDGLLDLLRNELGCCATDASGELDGGPLNAVLVGSGKAVRRAMMRGDWIETSATDQRQERARQQHFMGRSPDAIFTKQRQDGNERIQLHLWLAPWRLEGEPIWVATVFYFTEERSLLGIVGMQAAARDSELLSVFIQESVSADVDSAQRFLLQNLWYNGSLAESGHIRGPGAASIDNPKVGFGGIAYFTDGYRLVARLSEEPRALDETKFIYQVPIDPSGSEVTQ
jgi:hypothetical protein